VSDRPSGAAGSYGSLSEPELLRRLRAGDEALFREVVQQLTPVLMRLARGYTAAGAQDAVQDTWLVVLDKLDAFEGRSSLQTWVCGILVNKARRSGVTEARTWPFSSAWRDGRSPSVDPSRFHSRGGAGRAGTWAHPPTTWDQVPEDRLASHELQRVIHASIAALPTRQREVITARDVVGMGAAEAADLLGLTSGNQRVLLHRARSKVRAALEQYAADVIEVPPGGASNASRTAADRNRS
jgi:RNA polymerase sigma-70 factor (ECF subfamily)